MDKEKLSLVYRRAIKIVYYVCASFGLVAYVSFLLKLLLWPSNKIELVAAFLGIGIFGIPLFFRGFFEKKLPKKLFFVLENIFAYCGLFYLITFMMLSSFVLGAGFLQSEPEELSEDCVFIVYGAGLQGDRPGVTLQKRLDKAAEYMEELPHSMCIVSGGQGADEIRAEALVMRDYLVEKGVASERILVEDKSRNTLENLKNSYAIIEDEGLSTECVVSVSNAFHIPRIELITKRLGYEGRFVLA
ncbi:MAG: YdcF family protein, partial [Clostridia bacterium]|nr:YdcF family protein [Clostridia bacterium]